MEVVPRTSEACARFVTEIDQRWAEGSFVIRDSTHMDGTETTQFSSQICRCVPNLSGCQSLGPSHAGSDVFTGPKERPPPLGLTLSPCFGVSGAHVPV